MKRPKDEMEPIIITRTSSWTLLAYLYLQVLLPYVQVSHCSFGKPKHLKRETK